MIKYHDNLQWSVYAVQPLAAARGSNAAPVALAATAAAIYRRSVVPATAAAAMQECFVALAAAVAASQERYQPGRPPVGPATSAVGRIATRIQPVAVARSSNGRVIIMPSQPTSPPLSTLRPVQ